MMNTVVGSAIGGAVAGLVALGASAIVKPAPAQAYAPGPSPAYVETLPHAPAYAPQVVRTRLVSQPARTRVVARETTVARRESERSWGKTAMIIGGSAGGGAGLGGLIAGKKGALIGAAIGGGAATIYEARKR